MNKNGWRYSDNGNFKQRFPEWVPMKNGGWQAVTECAEFIGGRWEHFISLGGYHE